MRATHEKLLQEGAAIARIAALQRPLDQLGAELAAVLADPRRDDVPTLRAALERVESALEDVPSFLPCLAALGELPAELAEAFRTVELEPPALEAASARRSLDDALARSRDLARFDGRAREQHLARLSELHERLLQLNADAVRERLRLRFLDRLARQKGARSEYDRGRKELEHEFGKTMRYRAIRELSSGPASEAIRDLKPVWLMSPLSISDTLPLDSRGFDVVIFDEASQVPLEDAVPSLFRAPQVIVVGDPMQLPPTNFFGAKSSDEELLVEEDGVPAPLALDADSLLAHAARSMPVTMLGWHYRSRSESLIAFSNNAFYDGQLLTVPEQRLAGAANPQSSGLAKVLDRPLSFHFLEGAIYADRRNAAEAGFIAELVRGLLATERHPTVGVIAFSEAQQGEIERALDTLAAADPVFRERLEAEWEREEEGQFAGLLVKNLENIQGDERDVVILSICYGPGPAPARKMMMNFGPINQAGGERRLNVAFSRARKHMAVVSSIREAQITNDYNDGARCLRDYLAYADAASSGAAGAAQLVLRRLRPRAEAALRGEADAVVTQLAEAFRERGYIAEADVGQSGFRCDLAIRKPDATDFALGLLVDTRARSADRDILARDLMKPSLLRAFGWRIALVSTKDWLLEREKLLERLLAQAT
jgi:hypothetical protein